MTFKLKDKVISVMNGEKTDQIGTVNRIDSKGIVYVNPDEMPYVECRYLPDGFAIDNREGIEYSIIKLDNQTQGH
jgi:hypothetical protein